MHSEFLFGANIYSNFQTEDGNKRWSSLHDRIIEHNIRVVSKCYTRIRTVRLAQHLDLTVEKTEKHLSDLVVKNAVWARIGKLNEKKQH